MSSKKNLRNAIDSTRKKYESMLTAYNNEEYAKFENLFDTRCELCRHSKFNCHSECIVTKALGYSCGKTSWKVLNFNIRTGDYPFYPNTIKLALNSILKDIDEVEKYYKQNYNPIHRAFKRLRDLIYFTW